MPAVTSSQIDWWYATIILVAISAGLIVHHWTRTDTRLTWWQMMAVGVGGMCGGVIGAKLPFALADWTGLIDGTAWLGSGKTIVSGLLGGYLGVQVTEWALHLKVSMCDSFAAPVAVGIAIGRLGCFHAGCCYGVATQLPWGVDFGDGIRRHPTQLYEFGFHAAAAVLLLFFLKRQQFRGNHIRLYFLAYFGYRFVTEFIRPEVRLVGGLTGYQYATLFMSVILVVWGLPCCPAGWRLARRRRVLRTGLVSRQRQTLKPTATVCPTCLQPLNGEVYQEDGRVYLRRHCPEHGTTTALINGDRRHYYLRHEVPHPPPTDGAACCGGASHKTCVALLEITAACNLECPVCYAGSPSGAHGDTAALCADLDAFLNARGPLDILQLSGGEPLLHPDLLPLIDHAKAGPIDHIMINTNGIRLLHDPQLVSALAARCPKIEVSLQFDGLSATDQQLLRGADLVEQKQQIVDVLAAANIPTTLVCTIHQDTSDQTLKQLVRFALAHDIIRGLTIQPATWVGRYLPDHDPLQRTTLAEVLQQLEQQTGGLLAQTDFSPLPCSNPNCCSFTYIARRGPRKLVPLTRLVHIEDYEHQLADRMNFKAVDAQACCNLSWRAGDLLRIVVKPFMDAYTYDQDRIDECCVHVIRPGGRAESFCQYNTLHRNRQ